MIVKRVGDRKGRLGRGKVSGKEKEREKQAEGRGRERGREHWKGRTESISPVHFFAFIILSDELLSLYMMWVI